MLRIDHGLLEELGLGALPPAQANVLLRSLYGTLERHVGERIADRLSEEQLHEFEAFIELDDDNGAYQWLERNCPDYRDIVRAEFEALTSELGANADAVLRAASAAR